LRGENKKWGFAFEPHIPSDEAGGIMTINVFTFDMTVFHQQRICNRQMDFTIHDSTVFESPDPRQAGNVLAVAFELLEKHGGQYICAINSDRLDAKEFQEIIPREKSRAMTVLTLSDESVDTKLLRCNFGPQQKSVGSKKDAEKKEEDKSPPPAE
jgi:uncharacterized protein YydD (DUF2326 family)